MSMNYVTFNQDYSHLAVATSKGFRIYSTDPFQKAYESHDGDIGIIEMLFSTSLVAQILSPRRLVITNTKRQSTICELTFPTTVLAVRMNRKRLVVVLEDQIYLYDITNMKLLYTIETSPNPHAIAALSPSSDNCYLAYPLPQKAMPSAFAPPSHAPPVATHIPPTSGDVLLFDAVKLQAINVVEAHRAPLSCVALNTEGTLLATASDKGTIIRVFSVPQAQKLFQFRRGSMPSRICSMAFNSTSTLLCVSSTTETVHIFRLARPGEKQKNSSPPPESDSGLRDRSNSRSDRSASPGSEDPGESTSYGAGPDTSMAARKPNGTFAGMIRRTSQTVGKSFAATVGGYLPSAVTEIWEPTRDFACIRIPRPPGGSYSGPLRTVIAMSSNLPQVMVVTSEGSFFVFNIDLDKGGEGTLLKQYLVLESNERLGRSILE